MKSIVITLFVIFSVNLFAEPVTEELTAKEIQLAVGLANKYEVSLEVNGPCTKTQFDIVDTVKGFNPASWVLESNEKKFSLSNDEISGLIRMHNRLEISSVQINPITSRTRITIAGVSCGFSANKWTVTFND